MILGLVLGAGYYLQLSDDDGKYDAFAQCVTDSGAAEYGAYWCTNCKTQKEMFGKSWQYINYVECSIPNSQDQNPECEAANITGYPTWVFGDGERIEGLVSMERLAAITGCELPE